MSRDEPNDVPPPHTEEDQHRLRSRVEGLFRDVVRRTVHSGVNTALQTEESLRSIVGDIRLPREVVGYLLQQIDNTKRELVQIAAREFREFLESANIGEELAKILTTLSFEIRTEVRFIPNDQALKPNVSSRISVRNRNSGETISDEEAGGPFDDVIREAASGLAGRFIRTAPAADAKTSRQAGAKGESDRTQAPPKPGDDAKASGAREKAETEKAKQSGSTSPQATKTGASAGSTTRPAAPSSRSRSRKKSTSSSTKKS